MSQEDLEILLSFFKALSNESRLKIVGLLAQREASVDELAALLELRAPTVSHHLSILKAQELVGWNPKWDPRWDYMWVSHGTSHGQ